MGIQAQDPLAASDRSVPTALLMRHPQTTYNLQGRYLGADEAPLTEEGERERRRAVEGLVAWRPDRIVTSPLSRCVAIARDAAEQLGIACITDGRVGEMRFGVLEGLRFQEAVDRGVPMPWGPGKGTWPCEGGEPLADLLARTGEAMADVAKLPGRTAVVSHGGAIRAALSVLLGIQADRLWDLRIGNVSSSIVAFPPGGGPSLVAFGLAPEELACRR